jgi:hypothetical protein
MTSDVESTIVACIEALERGSTSAPVVEGLKSLAPALRALNERNTGWRCFHCDALFMDREAAGRHFGTRQHDAPLCVADQLELVAARKERDDYADIRAHVLVENVKLNRKIADLVLAAELTEALEREMMLL